MIFERQARKKWFFLISLGTRDGRWQKIWNAAQRILKQLKMIDFQIKRADRKIFFPFFFSNFIIFGETIWNNIYRTNLQKH